MKRALFGLCTLGLGLLSQSCVDDASSLFIVGLIAPDDECMYTEDGPGVAFPNYDPASGQPYYVALRVFSQLISRQTSISANPANVLVDSVDVTINTLDGSPLALGLPNPFRLPADGFIESSSDGTPAVGIVKLAIPAEAMGAIDGAPGGTVVLSLQLHGHTTGTIDLDSEPYEFPVALANNCGMTLASCLPGQDGNSRCGTTP